MDKKAASKTVTKAAFALFSGFQWGNMGDVAYLNGGGALFGTFSQQNPDYYIFRSEMTHIANKAQSIAEDIKDTEHLVIVGQGPDVSLNSKEMHIVRLLKNLKKITFVDISESFNQQALAVIAEYNKQSGRKIQAGALTMEFGKAAAHVDNTSMPTTVISTGSLISNVHNARTGSFPVIPLRQMLKEFSDLAGPDGRVVLGYDSNDDELSLRRAYNGQLAPFIINISQIIADHGEGITGFHGGPDYFDYKMEWDHLSSQVMHKLVVKKSQAFTIEQGGQAHQFTLRAGEEFVVMSSVKPSPRRMSSIAEEQDVNLVTDIVYQDRHGMVEHVFKRRHHGAQAHPHNDPYYRPLLKALPPPPPPPAG